MQTKRVPYTFNRSGYYYFSRRVPSDLLNHHSYPRLVQGLRTKSVVTAKSRALVAAAKLDEYWSHLRMAVMPDTKSKSLSEILEEMPDKARHSIESYAKICLLYTSPSPRD